MRDEGLTIGQVAERTGLSVHTLRFYEREGVLIGPVERDGGGRRRYVDDDVEWLTDCVANLRSTGMPLPEIRRYAELVRAGDGTEAERLELMRVHRARVLTGLDTLRRCLDLIEYKVSVYEQAVAGEASA